MALKVQDRELLLHRRASLRDTKVALQYYFDRTFKSNNRADRFSGFFISDNEFEIRSKWEMIFSGKPYRKPAYILGSLTPVSEHKTIIRLIQRQKQLVTSIHLIPFAIGILLTVFGFGVDKFKIGITIGIFFIFFFAVAIPIAYFISRDSVIGELKNELQLQNA